MKVSVCMITYGHQDYVVQAIEGVLMQECDFDIELIVANDCSPDNTDLVIQNILKSHPKASVINYIKHDKNLGMIPNFIFALQSCTGKYIALCEGDDYWTDSHKLQKQVDFLESHPEYVICFHKVKILEGTVFSSNDITEQRFSEIKTPKPSQKELIIHGNFIHTPSVVFRNNLTKFPKAFYASSVGDYFLYIIVSSKGYIKRLDDTMAIYRAGIGIFSSQKKLDMNANTLIYQACILSYLEDYELRQILLDRHLNVIANHNRIAKANAVNSKLANEKELSRRFQDLFVQTQIFI